MNEKELLVLLIDGRRSPSDGSEKVTQRSAAPDGGILMVSSSCRESPSDLGQLSVGLDTLSTRRMPTSGLLQRT